MNQRLGCNRFVRSVDRRGASLWEVIACVVAVGVGLWLGAGYLGIDLNSAAYTALSDSEMIDKLPEDLRPAPPPGAESPTPQQLEQELDAELSALRKDLANLADQGPGPETDEVDDATPADDAEADARLQATVAYWASLVAIVDEVQSLQQNANQSLSKENLYQVLDLRRRAYEYGVKAIDAAESQDADPQAVKFAGQVAEWFAKGGELYREAQNVWQSENLSAAGVTSDRLLEHVRRQHAETAKLLVEKSRRLQQVLAARYQAEFAPMDQALIAGN